ncbi:GntR family transcriptional regulator [Georgenia sp. TF02-10]|uniref:GntR family transcriptional regulator n=1 Tax=Georgenia sp. TF02-10 TaxID=2917725 RepID=UPI001FA6B3B5|nr:GntR family transcriptional regulator [Georgenia sp. TF02-10]UNX54618.1 GntR family transcriptional regulator [Georgenia sp. TF02-10]
MARLPLYRQVREKLLARIAQMRVGEMIPTEPELEQEFGVSRATVRRAVETLVSDGYLEKRQGRGTQVRARSETQDVGRVYSWTDEMRQRGVPTSSSHVVLRREKAGRRIASELGIKRDDSVVVISRVRHVSDAPIAIMVNFLDERAVPGLVERGLQGDSLYDELAATYGLELVSGEETIRAREATAVEAALLDIEEGASVLNVRRRTLDSHDVPVEVVDMVARGDRYQYHAQLTGGRNRLAQPAPRRQGSSRGD